MSKLQEEAAEAQEAQAAQVRDDDIVLSVNHVGKYFKLPTEQATGLKQAFINLTKGIKGYKIQNVLKDISFDAVSYTHLTLPTN